MDFRGHIVASAKLGMKITRSISTSHGASETEIGNLQLEVFVKQQVLRLEVAVSHSIAMAVVKALKSLFEVISSHRFAEGTRG